MVVAVDVFQQVGKQVVEVLVRRRDERRTARVERTPADPVLHLPHDASELGRRRVVHEGAMHQEQVVEFEGVGTGGEFERGFHGRDVADHLHCDAIAGVTAERESGFGSGESASRRREAFDLGRSDRLGPEQEPGEAFEAHVSGARIVQRSDDCLCVGDVRGDVGGDREIPPGQRVGEVRVVEAASSIPSTHPLELCVPALPQV